MTYWLDVRGKENDEGDEADQVKVTARTLDASCSNRNFSPVYSGCVLY